MVERRLVHGTASNDHWDDLVGAAPQRVPSWMRRKARLADGTKPGLPYAGAPRVLRIVEAEEVSRGTLSCRPCGKNRGDGWPVMRFELLRDLVGMTYVEISRRLACSPSMASRRVEQHARLLATDETYARLAATVAVKCLNSRTW